MAEDVITKLLIDNDYKNGNAVVYVNNILTSSGNLEWVQTQATMSGVENKLTERFDEINYYSGSGLYYSS